MDKFRLQNEADLPSTNLRVSYDNVIITSTDCLECFQVLLNSLCNTYKMLDGVLKEIQMFHISASYRVTSNQ